MSADRFKHMTTDELAARVSKHHTDLEAAEAALEERQTLTRRIETLEGFVKTLLEWVPKFLPDGASPRETWDVNLVGLNAAEILESPAYRRVLVAIEDKFGVSVTVRRVQSAEDGKGAKDITAIMVRYERWNNGDVTAWQHAIAKQIRLVTHF